MVRKKKEGTIDEGSLMYSKRSWRCEVPPIAVIVIGVRFHD